MKRTVAFLFAAALRNGDYVQNFERMKDKDGSVNCFGVLCNLHAKANPKIAARQTDPRSYLSEWKIPPFTVRKWAGLTDREVKFLMSLNDNKVPFKQMAQVIESYQQHL